MANPAIEWAKDNPVLAGGAALVVVVVIMFAFGGSGSDSENSGNGAGIGAYYAAVANQAQAGAAIQIEQIQQQGETNRALAAASYGLERDKVWAPVALAGTQASAANTSKQLDYAREIAIEYQKSNERIQGNYVNLANSQLAQQQNIAFKQANVQKSNATKGLFGSIFGGLIDAGAAVATGGLSLPFSVGPVKGLPTGGSWV